MNDHRLTLPEQNRKPVASSTMTTMNSKTFPFVFTTKKRTIISQHQARVEWLKVENFDTFARKKNRTGDFSNGIPIWKFHLRLKGHSQLGGASSKKKNTTVSVKVISRQRCIHQVARQATIPCKLFSVLLFASKYSVQL